MRNKKKRTLYECFFKRFFDFTLSLMALVILSPLFFLIFISSKIALGGKVIFSQYRPGKDGKVFKMYKFRSMTNAVDKQGNLLPDEQRITRYGKFLRKTSFDELPQLFNILKGDMSIVGPRPRLVKDVIFYDQKCMQILSVRPGLTGKSQVSGGRSEASWEKIFDCELSYIDHITFWNDLKVIFKTIGVVFTSGAAGGEKSSKREYFYCNYLLKTDQISAEQYAQGLELASQIISQKGVVKFESALH